MYEMIRVALALYLAHLLTDFVFQTARMVNLKRGGKISGYALHGAVHYAAAIVLTGFFVPGTLFSLRFQVAIIALTFIHLAIDWCKIALAARHSGADGVLVFSMDQMMHGVTIFLTAWWIVRAPSPHEMLRLLGILRRPDNKILLALVVYVAVIFGAGYLIRFLTKPLMRDLKVSESHAQLSNAGMFIGWLERFLILSALFEHSPATAGLILAAKSIARYPEFKREQFAEYFLIGTLLSISAAIIGGVVLLKVFYGSPSLP
jgi:Protein of unknown function (DUF3307)